MTDDLTTGTLTPNQRIRRNQLEVKIRTHIASFWEAGAALMEMRDSKLYREDYPTFEAYCDERWGFKDRHARRLIFASQVVNELGESGPSGLLVKESALREFSPLQPDQYQPTWAQVLEEAKGGRITASLVKRVVRAATDVAIEAIQTKGHVTIGEDSVPLIEGSITEKMVENKARQLQHIADNSQWDRLDTIEIAAGKLAAKLVELKVDPAEIIKVTIYKRKESA